VQKPQCDFDDQRGNLVLNVGTGSDGVTRVVPVAALAPQYAACDSENSRAEFVAFTAEAFGKGATDVPREFQGCGNRLLPQLWPVGKIMALQLSLPNGAEVPHCGLHGETIQLQSERVEDLVERVGVVLVCEYLAQIPGSGPMPVETLVVASDLMRWGVGFTEVLEKAMENLRSRTKSGPPAEKRWEYHPSGCAQSAWGDHFDAVRAALLPALVARRNRPEGAPDQGGQVVAFATPSCALATFSKNALGLCFMGDTVHTKIKPDPSSQLLSTAAFRLMKMRDAGEASNHPLNQKAGEGFVWRWLPYVPGGPPLKASGEFSVPIDAGEVEAILNAAEAGKPVPVFTHEGSGTATAGSKAAPVLETFAKKKEAANAFFKAGEFVKAIAAYDAALNVKPLPSDAEAAIAHANAAQAMLNLAASEEDETRRQGCAAEALRRGNRAGELDPTYAKAHARCAAACDILGEVQAAAEFRSRAEACGAAAEQKRETASSSASSSSSTVAPPSVAAH